MNALPAMDEPTARRLLGQMLLIRRLEERAVELYGAGKIRGFLHLYNGEEAVATGVIHRLQPEDTVVSHYRDHGHALCRGVSARAVMAELFGKLAGCSRGRGGSMHLFDRRTRLLGGNAIVGGGLPLAVGVALGDRILGRQAIAATFFGDGAVAEGAFHEALNLASLWRLPVLFVCENNLYAMGTAIARHQAQLDLVLKAGAYGIPGEAVDGMDLVAVDDAARRAVDAVRGGDGPRFLECRTYRFRAHSMFDAELYRDKAEVERWKQRDPIKLFAHHCLERGLADRDVVAALEAEAAAAVEDAVAFAEAAPLEPVEELTRFVHSEEAR